MPLYSKDSVDACEAAYRESLSQRRPLLSRLVEWRRSPVGACVFVLLFLVFYLAVSHAEPVDQLNETNFGVQEWVEDYVRFDRMNGDDGKIDQIESLDDIVYFSRALVQDLLPMRDYAGEITGGTRPSVLLVNKLVNSILLVQQREGSAPPDACLKATMPGKKLGCSGLAPDDRRAMWMADPHLSTYAAELPLNAEEASAMLKELIAERWWDHATRTFILFFAFANKAGDFTGTCEIRFWLSPYGGVREELFTTFLRLDVPPALSMTALAVIGLLVCASALLLVAGVVGQPHPRWSLAELLHPWVLIELLAYCMVCCTCIRWMQYMGSPYRLLVDNDAQNYQHLMLLAKEWKEVFVAAGLAMLCMTVRMIEFLGHVGAQVKYYTRVLSRAVERAMWVMVVFLVVFLGFAISANVLFGEQLAEFSSVEQSMLEISKWWVTLADPPQTMFKQSGGSLYFVLFVAILMILLFNMFVMIVISSAEAIRYENEVGGVQHPTVLILANTIADSLKWSVYEDDPFNDASLLDDEKSILNTGASKASPRKAVPSKAGP